MRKTAAVLAITMAYLVSPSGTTYADHMVAPCLESEAGVMKNKYHYCRVEQELNPRLNCMTRLHAEEAVRISNCNHKWKRGHSADYGKIDPQGRIIKQ